MTTEFQQSTEGSDMWRVPSILIIAVFGIVAPLISRADDSEAAAETAASAWLAVVDAGDYAKSWTAASGYFRGRIAQSQWVSAVAGVRGPLGALKSRHVSSVKFTRALPGAPDGEYVVIQFASSFEKKAAAMETVT